MRTGTMTWLTAHSTYRTNPLTQTRGSAWSVGVRSQVVQMAKGRSVKTWTSSEEDAHEGTAEDGSTGAPLFTARAFASIASRWLDLANPHKPKTTSAMRQARRICGRWIAHRRRTLNLSVERLAETIGTSAEAVHLIELGLAGEDLFDADARECLIRLLKEAKGEDWAADVIATALGRYDVCTEETLARATATLQQEVSEKPSMSSVSS